jgi:hypothetical protein
MMPSENFANWHNIYAIIYVAVFSGRKDSNGKLFVAEFVKVVQSKGSGWVDYMFPKPGQSQPSQKWSYVKAVNTDGTPALVGAGFYASATTPSNK